MNHYDVIIIGGGIAGTTAGATLASEAGKKVLVLEQASQLGGRATSFRGEGIKDVQSHAKTLQNAALSAVSDRSEPPLQEMIDNKMLDGYVFETGVRGSWRANRGRVSKIAEYYNKASIFFPTSGFAAIGVDGDFTAKTWDVPNTPEWMTDEDYAEMIKVAKARNEITTLEEMEKFKHTTLKEWLGTLTTNKKAIEWHVNRAGFHTVANDAALNTVDEDMMVNRIYTSDPTVGIDNGAWGYAGSPGYIHYSNSLADVVRQHGGEVKTNVLVKEVIIEDSKTNGVIATVAGVDYELNAPVVISTLPPHHLSKIFNVEDLDENFQIASKRLTKAACISMFIGLDRPMREFASKDYPEKAFIWGPVVARSEEGFKGDIPIVGYDLTAVAPTCSPEGKYLYGFVTNVLAEEASDEAKSNLVIDRMFDFFDNAYPGWRSVCDFKMVLVNEGALLWRLPEDERADVVCENIDGLYFAGDSFGKHCSCGGTEGATQSALYCVEAITGLSLRSKMLGDILA